MENEGRRPAGDSWLSLFAVQRTFTKLEGKLAEVEDRKAIDVGSVN